MGIFDIFFAGGSPEKQIKRYGAKLRNKDTPIEDRQAAAAWLAKNGSHDAIMALVGRFEMTYEHHMKDASEKDDVSNYVLNLGKKAIEPLAAYLRRARQFARPLALYEQLAGRDAAVLLALELLEVESRVSELKPEKKRELLVKLAEYRDARVVEPVLPMLDAFDEGVRYAAVEVLLAQDETPVIRDALLDRLASPEEESGRLRGRIAQVAASRRWPLGERSGAVAARLPQGVRLVDDVLQAT